MALCSLVTAGAFVCVSDGVGAPTACRLLPAAKGLARGQSSELPLAEREGEIKEREREMAIEGNV